MHFKAAGPARAAGEKFIKAKRERKWNIAAAAGLHLFFTLD
jgi:hypothetical protein